MPISWTILDSAYGDLNKDGIKDAAIILQHKDSVSVINGLQDTDQTTEVSKMDRLVKNLKLRLNKDKTSKEVWPYYQLLLGFFTRYIIRVVLIRNLPIEIIPLL